MSSDGEPTEGELFLRYEQLVNLAEDLLQAARRKLAADPGWQLKTLLDKVRQEVAAGNWALSDSELGWVLKRVEQRLQEPAT